MRWVITGGHGMLGQDVAARVVAAGYEAVPLGRAQLDVTDPVACEEALRGADVVVNCAAWTNVDEAEAREGAAFDANAVGPAHVARAARRAGARTVQVSTDYVFDGAGSEPYREDAPVRPLSAYGRTKAAGEWAVRANDPDSLVVRTAWLYGAGGPNFAATMVRLARERGEVSVVDDQWGQPTWTVDLADLVVRLVTARAPGGIYHGTSAGRTTWCRFAREVVAAAGLDPAVIGPLTSAEFVRPAPRPAFSVLGTGALDAIGVAPIGDWAQRWAVAAPTVLAAAR